jgi:1-acyl-sn-glycerol-3-phosphate acyltransferase
MIQENSIQNEDARDRKKFVFHRTLFRKILVGTIRKVLPAFVKVEIIGLENIPETGPVVLAANHLTNYDVFPMQMVIQRPLFFMAKSELHKNPIMDMALRNVGAFPVHRGQRDQWAILHAAKVLEHDQVLAFFPEGTRSKGQGLRAGKTGAARLAIQAGCAIIPVAIDGTHKMFKNFPKRTLIRMVVGKPIYPDSSESTLSLTDRMMFSIADMLPEDLRGVYSKRPIGFK